ncbi:hypothetical protein I4U23_027578 [Adineta vaga]|nr:hypothetical protein I4U23_027578 [Adineta vaga]
MGKKHFGRLYRRIREKLGTITCKISHFCDEFDESCNYAGAIIYAIDGEYKWKNDSGGKADGFKGRSFYLIIQCTDDWPESCLNDVGQGRVHDYLLKNVLGIDYHRDRIACGGFSYVDGKLKYNSIWLNASDQEGAESNGDKMLSDKEKMSNKTIPKRSSRSSSKSKLNCISMSVDPEDENDLIRIVCISDTHNGHSKQKFNDKIRKINADILIHAGDFGEHGTDEERTDFLQWLESLTNFQYKIFIAGNMDAIGLDNKCEDARRRKHLNLVSNDSTVIYLENESCKVLGIKIYGCPYTPEFYGGFQYVRQSQQAMDLWENIPIDCDLLISHGPPRKILDQNSRGDHVGCRDLKEAIWRRPSLKAIIFGHVHRDYGITRKKDKWFINAAQYNGIYENDIENRVIELSIRRNDKMVYEPYSL